jgi:leader peptidase (prepilin peptidase)/N-methyltransferase
MVGGRSTGVALIYCLVLAGFIVATFVDLEHFIIPDQITIGGMALGLVCSFVVPSLHGEVYAFDAMKKSLLGMALGSGLVYLILRAGKLAFGRHKVSLPPESRVIFTETALVLPEEEIPYEEIFYRKTDTIQLEAKRLELTDRCYWSVPVRLRPDRLQIGQETLDPETVPFMEALTDRIILPREAMGFGDVKFMGAIGAFLGMWATVFSLLVSSILGGVVGLSLIAMRKREWSSRVPYGPYIALAAVIWMFGGDRLFFWWVRGGWLPR